MKYCRHRDHEWNGIIKNENGASCGTCSKSIKEYEIKPPEKKCSVKQVSTGENCPEPPRHNVVHHGKNIDLCEKCYRNWASGFLT